MTDEGANPAFYDADSAAYDARRFASAAGAYTNRVQQRIVADLTGDWKAARVLEVGPGTARFTIPLAGRGHRMTLVDVSAGMLEVAQRKLEGQGLAGQVEDAVSGSIYALPFEDGRFDHAICLNVFNHLARAGEALAELARVTRPRSTLLFNFANAHSVYWPAARRINRRSTAVGQEVYSVWERPAAVRRMIARAGLEVARAVGHVHVPRGLEKLPARPLAMPLAMPPVMLLDAITRRGPLRSVAPVQYRLCRKR